jgi:ribosome-associated heat shock protein Hsp15
MDSATPNKADTNSAVTNKASMAPTGPDRARVDQWLWSVRIYHTRSAATEACRAGHVRVNGTSAKPATPVRVGDEVSVRAGERDRSLEVSRVISRRVGAPIAAQCLIDHSPPVAQREGPPSMERPRGSGRPTKTDRRAIDKLRGH